MGVVGWELFLVLDGAINRFNRRLKAGESWGEVGACGSGGHHLLGHGAPLAHKALARFAEHLNFLLGHSRSPSPEGVLVCREAYSTSGLWAGSTAGRQAGPTRAAAERG